MSFFRPLLVLVVVSKNEAYCQLAPLHSFWRLDGVKYRYEVDPDDIDDACDAHAGFGVCKNHVRQYGRYGRAGSRDALSWRNA